MPQRRNPERELIVSLACVVACVLLALLSTGRDGTRRAMDAVASALVPLERPAVFVMDRIGQFRRWTAERRELLMELAELREENRELKMQSGSKIADEIRKHVRPENRYPVVYRDPRTWWEELRISTQGRTFEPGSAVLDGSDLMGVITSQSGDNAWVRLITSANFYVPVVVEETREIGVVTGDNESGKTTVANFIRSMLYGMRESGFYERYLPYDYDGVYGGSMKVLTGALGGNQILYSLVEELMPDTEQFSYSYQGNMQELDHIYVTSALWDKAASATWSDVCFIPHINSMFTRNNHYNLSDHDPAIINIPGAFE